MNFKFPLKIIIAIFCISISSTVFANNDFYAGISAGYGMTNWKNFVSDFSNDNGLVSRIFAGYDFNQYLAAEVGYAHFFNKSQLGEGATAITIRTQAFDLMAKLKAPLSNNLNVYAKAGLGYLDSNINGAGFDSRNNFNLVYGLGAEYAITSRIIADISWIRYSGNSTTQAIDKYQPDADALMLGIRFAFSDIWEKAAEPVNESNNGLYVGLAAGYDNTNWPTTASGDTAYVKMAKINGMMEHIFFGYDFNRYFATELGYSYFNNKASESHAPSPVVTATVLTQAFDFLGKLKIPVVGNFDLYAKAGLGYLMSHPTATNNDPTVNRNNLNIAYGLGCEYSFTPKVIMDVSWLRYNGYAKMTKDYQPYADVFMIGIRYKVL